MTDIHLCRTISSEIWARFNGLAGSAAGAIRARFRRCPGQLRRQPRRPENVS